MTTRWMRLQADNQGNITAAFNGVAPAQDMMDVNGIGCHMPWEGAGTLLVFDPAGGNVM